MTDTLIAEIYETLVSLRMCKSRSEFSRDWLGRERAYYRSVIARKGTVSMEAQAHLIGSLRNIGTCFGRSEFDWLARKGHVLIDLHSKCLEDLLGRAALNACERDADHLTPDACLQPSFVPRP